MKFNEQCKVIIETLNRDEAIAFIKFLQSEIWRHEEDIRQARELMMNVSIKYGLDEWGGS